MTIILVALVLLCLITGTAMAQDPKVTSLMSKDLTGGLRCDAAEVKGGRQVTLTPGQTFYEGPDDVHVVDWNASGTKPAKFLVFLIKNKGAPALVPVE